MRILNSATGSRDPLRLEISIFPIVSQVAISKFTYLKKEVANKNK